MFMIIDCGCVIKEDEDLVMTFDSMDEALLYAETKGLFEAIIVKFAGFV